MQYTWKQMDEIFRPIVEEDPTVKRQCHYYDYDKATKEPTTPHCAVGVIFDKLGLKIPVDFSKDVSGLGPNINDVFHASAELRDKFDHDARRYLRRVQSHQDCDESWGDSREFALKAFDLKED